MKRVASELCPNCEATSEIEWDTELQGFKTICPDCGKPLMLCSLCYDDNVECSKCAQVTERKRMELIKDALKGGSHG